MRKYPVTQLFDRFFRIEPIHAHCDVPCGIYDPHGAQVAAKTVHAMVKKATELTRPEKTDVEKMLAYRNTLVRMITTKEDHARICKQELLILWTDYFKPEALKLFPDLHDIFWKATKLVSYNKQHMDLAKAEELMKAVDQIADMFHKAEAAKK